MTATPPPLTRDAQNADFFRELADNLDFNVRDTRRTLWTGVVNAYRAGGRVTGIQISPWKTRTDGAETRTITVRGVVSWSDRRFRVTVSQVRLTRQVIRDGQLCSVTAGGAAFLTREWVRR